MVAKQGGTKIRETGAQITELQFTGLGPSVG